MNSGVWAITFDLIREALARRWILALLLAMTLVLGGMSLGLSVEVVDGALAATRLFGTSLDNDIRAADVALRPVFEAAAYVIFYGGLCFGILACSDFVPSLLAPGRIEHLLSLPVRRSALIIGTYGGVFLVMAGLAAYGALGFTVVLGLKTGVWTPRLLAAALLAVITFAAIFGVMVTAAVFVRSSALSALAGGALCLAGLFSGNRDQLLPMFEPGKERTAFEIFCVFFPPVAAIARAAGDLAASLPIDRDLLLRQLAGLLLFGAAAVAVGIWRFEQKDF
ncbi:MAG: ABC transporter permease subunit [Deltaproteobacteria bacterium]|jgi:hypothetical protein|nr:ABC transporter permease subunit [Deltaproteobacteria bacterium]